MSFWPVTKKVIKESDVVLFIMDARMPRLSRNKSLEKKIAFQGTRVIRVFNKIDCVSENFLDEIRGEFPNDVFVSGKTKKGIEELRRAILNMADSLGLSKIKVGVVGYPNMGKSSIINALLDKPRIRSSRIPGTTKKIEFVESGRLIILDSPGVVPFKDGENQLAILGSKNPEKLKSPEKAALMIIDEFLDRHKEKLENYYGITAESESYDTFVKIGEKKKLLLKGGIIDERRTALLVINDWQNGKLGF